MYKLVEYKIYIGTKEEYNEALEKDMNIVCALNRCDRTPQYVSHQSVVGWTGRGCNKDNPYYLFKKEDPGVKNTFALQKELQPTMEAIKEQMIEDMEGCGLMRNLDISSMQTDPEKRIISVATGWSLSFEFET